MNHYKYFMRLNPLNPGLEFWENIRQDIADNCGRAAQLLIFYNRPYPGLPYEIHPIEYTVFELYCKNVPGWGADQHPIIFAMETLHE